MDKRLKKLASIIVDYSLKLEHEEYLMIMNRGDESVELAREVEKQASKKGVFPVFWNNSFNYARYCPDDCLEKEDEVLSEFASLIDAFLIIDGSSNIYNSNVVSDKNKLVYQKKMKRFTDIRLGKKWCIVRYPSNGYAQQAGMSLEEYEDYAFRTMNIDWEKKKNSMKKTQSILEKAENVRIIGEKTDLRLCVKDRNFIICAGECNLPDGEIFTSPHVGSVSGELFVPKAFRMGREFKNIRLVFKNGAVVDYNCESNKEFLKKILNTDEGAKKLGELGFGTNRMIKKLVGDILFDEKKGGTVHLALGHAYKECIKEKELKKSKEKVLNKSSVHWDLIIRPDKVLIDDSITLDW